MSRKAASPSTRPVGPLLAAASVAMVVLLAIGGLNGYRDLAAAQQREAILETRIEEAEARILGLTRRIEQLQSDPATLERLARERLGMMRPGDVVIVLDSELAAPRLVN